MPKMTHTKEFQKLVKEAVQIAFKKKLVHTPARYAKEVADAAEMICYDIAITHYGEE